MLEKLLSYSNKKDIKVITDPERLRPIDADLQVPDTSKFQKIIPDGNLLLALIRLWKIYLIIGEIE